MSVLDDPITPTDIGVCIALPIDRASFLRSLEKPPGQGDYLRKLVRYEGDTAENLYDRAYSPAAAVMKQFSSTMRDLGVSVWQGATLDTVRKASKLHPITVFAGHWKGHPFAQWDFIAPPIDIFACLQQNSDNIVKCLVEDMLRQEPDLTAALAAGSNASVPRLTAALNRGMERLANSDPVSPGTLDVLTQSDLDALRERLDEVLLGLSVPGNRFEVADRFVDAYAFAEAFPDKKEGIADLVVCRSKVPAPAFNRTRPLIRTISAPHELNPFAWPNLIEATVRILDRESVPYWDARQAALEMLMNMVERVR